MHAVLADVSAAPKAPAAILGHGNPRTSDRRTSQRFPALGRAARLIALGDTGLCRIQDLSNGGASLGSTIATRCGDPVQISFDSNHVVPGRVVWRDGTRIGIRFSTPVDAVALIRELTVARWDRTSRAPRLPVWSRANVITNLGPIAAVVRDISQKGMKLCHAGGLAGGMDVEVRLARGLAVRGKVRWSDTHQAGIELSGMLTVEELASAKAV